jgi:hypothetical protein
MIQRKYGKPSKEILKLKENYIYQNDFLLNESIREIEFYKKQPVRSKCKNCKSVLVGKHFNKLSVNYILCEECGHLNGENKDTKDFCNYVYRGEQGKKFSTTYRSNSINEYRERVKNIYSPKAEYLISLLEKENKNIQSLKFTDIGAGSGYFVSALKNNGIQAIQGYEVSEYQVKYANEMIGSNAISQIGVDETHSILSKIDSNVVSMIGVLEHIQDPYSALNAIKNNKNIEYLYLLVPMFSLSVFLEIGFPKVMSRVLPGAGFGGHTHLYTPSSLKWIENNFNFSEVSSWWFGTDIADLYRSITVMMNKNGCDEMKDYWSEIFTPLIDDLQLQVDKSHLSSELHILFKINR